MSENTRGHSLPKRSLNDGNYLLCIHAEKVQKRVHSIIQWYDKMTNYLRINKFFFSSCYCCMHFGVFVNMHQKCIEQMDVYSNPYNFNRSQEAFSTKFHCSVQ